MIDSYCLIEIIKITNRTTNGQSVETCKKKPQRSCTNGNVIRKIKKNAELKLQLLKLN